MPYPPQEFTCPVCQKTFTRRPPSRAHKDGLEPMHCSKSCGGVHGRATGKGQKKVPKAALRVWWRVNGTWQMQEDIAKRCLLSEQVVAAELRKLHRDGRVERFSGIGGEWFYRRIKNRTCQHPGCQTVLSAYNPDPYCDVHRLPDPLPYMQWMSVYGEAL